MRDWLPWIIGLGALFGLSRMGRAMPRPGPGGGRMPQGKGVFVGSLSALGTDPGALADYLSGLNIQWVALQVYWKDYGDPAKYVNGPTLGPYAEAMRARGIDVWIWGFPSPDDVPGFTERTAWAYGASVPRFSTPPAPNLISGMIADPEKPYYAKRHAAAAQQQMRELVNLGRPVGVTSYGNPAFHPAFPWEAWSDGASFGVPQVYSNRGQDYAATSAEQWRKRGYARIIPALGAWEKQGSEMPQLFDWAKPAMRDGAVIWWSLRHIRNNATRASYVRDAKLPGGAFA